MSDRLHRGVRPIGGGEGLGTSQSRCSEVLGWIEYTGRGKYNQLCRTYFFETKATVQDPAAASCENRKASDTSKQDVSAGKTGPQCKCGMEYLRRQETFLATIPCIKIYFRGLCETIHLQDRCENGENFSQTESTMKLRESRVFTRSIKYKEKHPRYITATTALNLNSIMRSSPMIERRRIKFAFGKVSMNTLVRKEGLNWHGDMFELSIFERR